MTKSIFHERYGVAIDQTPRKHSFQLKDNRQDPLVSVCLNALWNLHHRLVTPLPHSTGLITVSSNGCLQHIQRVTEGVASGLRPRQAFFARAGMHIMSTYASLALASHGPCFSISGDGSSLRWGLHRACALLQNGSCDAIVILAADYRERDLLAYVVAFDQTQTERWPAAIGAAGVAAALPTEEMAHLLSLLESGEATS